MEMYVLLCLAGGFGYVCGQLGSDSTSPTGPNALALADYCRLFIATASPSWTAMEGSQFVFVYYLVVIYLFSILFLFASFSSSFRPFPFRFPKWSTINWPGGCVQQDVCAILAKVIVLC